MVAFTSLLCTNMQRCRNPRGVSRFEVEELLEPDSEAGMLADLAQPEQHTRGERDPVEGVVANRQRLPHATEDHLLVRDQAAHAQAMHVNPVDLSATRAIEP